MWQELKIEIGDESDDLIQTKRGVTPGTYAAPSESTSVTSISPEAV